MKEWQKKWQCALCEDIIWSKYSGEYVSCKCGAIAVDQTTHYSRHIGKPSNFIEVGEIE